MSPFPQAPPPDTLRSTLREVFSAPEYNWRGVESFWETFEQLRDQVSTWFEGLRTDSPTLYWVTVGLLAGLGLAMLVHLGWLTWRALRPRHPAREGSQGPEPAVRDAGWHRAEAERAAASGRYAEALAHRFTALLLELDRREALTFHPSKTPAEYTREVKLDEQGRSQFAELVAGLYRYLFAGVPCTRDDLVSFQRRADELRGHVAAI